MMEIIDSASPDELLELGQVAVRAKKQLDLLRLERFVGHGPEKRDRLAVALRIAAIMVRVHGLGGESGMYERVHLSPRQKRVLAAVIEWRTKFNAAPTRSQVAGTANMSRRSASRLITEMIKKGLLHASYNDRRIGLATPQTAAELAELVERFAQLRTGAGGNNGTRQGSPLPEAKDVRGKDAAAPREGRTRHYHDGKKRRAA